MNIRLAAKDDADAIWAFWLSLDEDDNHFRCSPGEAHPFRMTLDSWLSGSDTSIAIAEQDGVIVCTNAFNPSTAQDVWVNVSNENTAAYSAVSRQVSEWCGKPVWGFVGFVPALQRHVELGWRERDDGSIEWVG